MRAPVEPGIELRRVLEHAMLDINFFRLVARPGEVEPGEQPARMETDQLVTIEEISAGFLVPENEPVPALGRDRTSLVQKGAKRRNARPGSDHDDRRVAARRETERLVRMHKDSDARFPRHDAMREERRTDALPSPAMEIVMHGADRQ